MVNQRDAENSSLNDEAHRLNEANRRRPTRISAQTFVRTLGQIIFIVGLIVLAVYVLTDQMSRKSCKDDGLYFSPVIDKNGILELSWDSLPTAIRTVSNLVIIEHNSQCGQFNLTSLQSLTCNYLTLAYMSHSAFSFRHTSECTSATTKSSSSLQPKQPCFGLRWITNRLDTYHGPFVDLEDLKQWFDNVTSSEYIGCMGKPGTRLDDLTSSIHQEQPERTQNSTNL